MMELPESYLNFLEEEDLNFELLIRNRFLRDARYDVKLNRLSWALRAQASITHLPIPKREDIESLILRFAKLLNSVGAGDLAKSQTVARYFIYRVNLYSSIYGHLIPESVRQNIARALTFFETGYLQVPGMESGASTSCITSNLCSSVGTILSTNPLVLPHHTSIFSIAPTSSVYTAQIPIPSVNQTYRTQVPRCLTNNRGGEEEIRGAAALVTSAPSRPTGGSLAQGFQGSVATDGSVAGSFSPVSSVVGAALGRVGLNDRCIPIPSTSDGSDFFVGRTPVSSSTCVISSSTCNLQSTNPFSARPLDVPDLSYSQAGRNADLALPVLSELGRNVDGQDGVDDGLQQVLMGQGPFSYSNPFHSTPINRDMQPPSFNPAINLAEPMIVENQSSVNNLNRGFLDVSSQSFSFIDVNPFQNSTQTPPDTNQTTSLAFQNLNLNQNPQNPVHTSQASGFINPVQTPLHTNFQSHPGNPNQIQMP